MSEPQTEMLRNYRKRIYGLCERLDVHIDVELVAASDYQAAAASFREIARLGQAAAQIAMDTYQKQSDVAREGWGVSPLNGRKCHYFTVAGFSAPGISLCGKVGLYWGHPQQGNDDSADNCAACKRLLAKHREEQ